MSNIALIKEVCEEARKTIATGEATLRIAQAACEHQLTFEGNWSWRVGSSIPATICSICGSLVRYNMPKLEPEVQASVATDDDSSNQS